MGFQHRSDAERFLDELRQRRQRFGLELHPQKTRIIEFALCATRLDQIEQHPARLAPRMAAKGVAVDRNVGRAGADVRAVPAIGFLLAACLEQDALTEMVDLPVIVALDAHLPAGVGEGERRIVVSLARQGFRTEALIRLEPVASVCEEIQQLFVAAGLQQARQADRVAGDVNVVVGRLGAPDALQERQQQVGIRDHQLRIDGDLAPALLGWV